jgi:hypothetical protein
VHRGGAEAAFRAPGDGPGERVVDLEDARPGLVLVEPAQEAGSERRAGEALQRGDPRVEEGGVGCGQLAEVGDVGVEHDAATERLQMRDEGIGERLCAAGQDGPAGGVGGSDEDDASGRAGDLRERQNGVRGAAGEERPCGLVAEDRAGQHACRQQRGKAEEAHRDGMAGESQQGAGEVIDQLGPVAHGAGKERAPGGCIVRAELCGGGFERRFEREGGSVVERMRAGGVRLNPAQAVLCQRQRTKEGRRDAERVGR